MRVTVTEIPASLPAYDRHDWKHWTDANGDCQDARNEALIAESRGTISYRTERRCRVSGGEWLAPYTGTVVTDPSKLDVDHMVPLGNAHISGAWRWTAHQREQYANYLDDPQHLIAVTARTNRTRSERLETGKPGLLVPVRHRLDHHDVHPDGADRDSGGPDQRHEARQVAELFLAA